MRSRHNPVMTKFQIVLADGSTNDWEDAARYTVTDGGVLTVRSGETKVTYGPASWQRIVETADPQSTSHGF